MGVLSSLVHNRKRIFLFIVSLNILIFCLWIYVTIQKQTPIKRTATVHFDQDAGELLATSRPYGQFERSAIKTVAASHFEQHTGKLLTASRPFGFKKTPIKRVAEAHFEQHAGELLTTSRPFGFKQTPIKRVGAGHFEQHAGELLATSRSSRFKLTAVNQSQVNKWQVIFFKSLARVQERPGLVSSMKTALRLYTFNQSQLNKNNQFNLSEDEPRESIKIADQNGLLQFLETASCRPISPDAVLYNRVFKTGSETSGAIFNFVGTMMNYFYTRQTTEDFYDQGISTPYPMIVERMVNNSKKPVLFNSHFYFRNDLKVRRTHTYVNQIREPVARYISHYAYMRTKNRPIKRVNEMILSGEFNETIEQCFEKQGQGCKHNVMTRFFCGTEEFCKNDAPKALERAKKNILNHYAVVGLLEHFHLTLKIIQRRLPFFLPVVPVDPEEMRLNEGRKKLSSTSVSDEMIDKIKRANWADVELYEFVTQLFWKQAQACGLS